MPLSAMWLLLRIAAVTAAELLPDFYFRGGEEETTGGIRGLGVSERHLAGGFRYGALFVPSFLGLMTSLDCKGSWKG